MIKRIRFGVTTSVMLLASAAIAHWFSCSLAAQEQAGVTPWEYRAVVFHPSKGVDEHTRQLDNLSSAGWEYIGVLIPPFNSGTFAPKSTVVFRRSNRDKNGEVRGSLPSQTLNDGLQQQGDRTANDNTARIAAAVQGMRAASKQLLELRTREYQASETSFSALWAAYRQLVECEQKLAATAKERMEILGKQLDLAKEMEKVVEARYRVGDAAQTDVLQARLARMQIELLILEQAE